MPFKSKAQMKYMFANMPEQAKEWAKETPSISKLPSRKAPGKTVSKSKLRKGKKRYAAQGGKPKTNLGKGK